MDDNLLLVLVPKIAQDITWETKIKEIIVMVPELNTDDSYVLQIKVVGWEVDRKYEVERNIAVKFFEVIGNEPDLPLIVDDHLWVGNQIEGSNERSSEKFIFNKGIIIFLIVDSVILLLIFLVLMVKAKRRNN